MNFSNQLAAIDNMTSKLERSFSTRKDARKVSHSRSTAYLYPMKQKKIFISGASRGIGLAIARKFYSEGYLTLICSRNPENLSQAKAEMPHLVTFTCDISKKEEVKSLADQIVSEYGALDVLVNNGGVFLPGEIHKEDESVFEMLMATNLNSAYYFTRGLLPPMIEKQQGTIVNMCSVASLKAYPGGGSYCTSKFALLGFSKSLREEMKPNGIGVVSVMPGAVFTDSWAGANIPEERMIPAEDIATLVYTACSLSDRTVLEDIVVRPSLGDL
jgi:NAD(P)-dependent dehydrogenase (short-subunit alcohol dehydrogenase family)